MLSLFKTGTAKIQDQIEAVQRAIDAMAQPLAQAKDRRDAALLDDNMSAAEAIDREIEEMRIKERRLRDQHRLFEGALARAIEADRKAAEDARAEQAARAVAVARRLIKAADKQALELASNLRKIAAAEEFAMRIGRETGCGLGSVYEELAVPATVTKMRESRWVAVDASGQEYHSTPWSLTADREPQVKHWISADEDGKDVYAKWELREREREVEIAPSLNPGFIHEAMVLPALMPGAPDHWDKDRCAEAVADAEAIVLEMLKK